MHQYTHHPTHQPTHHPTHHPTQGVQQYLAVAKRAALYLARTSPQQTIDSLVCEVQAMQAQEDVVDGLDLGQSMELRGAHERGDIAEFQTPRPVASHVAPVPASPGQVLEDYARDARGHMRHSFSFRPTASIQALTTGARCGLGWMGAVACGCVVTSVTCTARMVKPMVNSQSWLSNESKWLRNTTTCVIVTSMYDIFLSIFFFSDVSHRPPPELTAPLRKAATELFKVTGISARSDAGSEHESRLSASFASASGFDGVLSSLTLEEGVGTSPGISRTHSNEVPRRTRFVPMKKKGSSNGDDA